jgi:hypothetical protein
MQAQPTTAQSRLYPDNDSNDRCAVEFPHHGCDVTSRSEFNFYTTYYLVY